MPRKSKQKSTSLDLSAPKPKRGRPRKVIAPEALISFGESEVPTIEKLKCPEPKSESVVEIRTNRRMNPTTSDRRYTADEVEFMNALSEFKRASGRTFPTCSEILSVLRQLGYAKVT